MRLVDMLRKLCEISFPKPIRPGPWLAAYDFADLIQTLHECMCFLEEEESDWPLEDGAKLKYMIPSKTAQHFRLEDLQKKIRSGS